MAVPTHDVVVVGSGAGGGAVAWALSRRGVRVLVLEAGPTFDPFKDYRLASNDWEQHRFPEKPGSQGKYAFAEMQLLEARWQGLRSWNRQIGPLVGGDRRRVHGYHHVRGVGGTTLHFTGEAHRLHPRGDENAHALRRGCRLADRLRRDLEPYYRTPSESSASRARRGPDAPAQRALSVAAASLDATRAASSARARASWGSPGSPNSYAALSRPLRRAPGLQLLRQLQSWLSAPRQGQRRHHLPRQGRATGNCTIRTEARGAPDRGRRARPRGPGRVRRRRSKHAPGRGARRRRRVRRRGDAAAAAALSGQACARRPRQRVGARSGAISWKRCSGVSSGLHPEPLGSHRGLPSDAICWDYNAPDAIPGVIGGCRFTPGMAEADLVGPIAYATRVVAAGADPTSAKCAQTFGACPHRGAIGESLPDAGSYVDLDPERRDASGVPLARIHSHLRRARAASASNSWPGKSREILKARASSGSSRSTAATMRSRDARLRHVPDGQTTRTDSVVDPYGRSHRWRNLFVTDASVFPSSGGGEAPSLTIEALAIRSAERLVELVQRHDSSAPCAVRYPIRGAQCPARRYWQARAR